MNLKLKGAPVAIQGFGNVGYHAAVAASELGCKVVAVSDSSGGILTVPTAEPSGSSGA